MISPVLSARIVNKYRQFAVEKIIATILLSVFSTIVRADLPLTVEDLLTAKDRYRLDVTV